MLALLLAAACTIPLTPTRTAFVAAVRIGASRPLRFLVDTGSSLTVIDRSVARELAIEPERRVTAVSTTGALRADETVLENVRTGDLTLARTPALVADLPTFASHGHLDGILGMSMFNGRSVLLDLRRRCVELDGAPPRGVPVRAHEVAGRVAIDAEGLSFVLDSGASFPVLKSPAARAFAAPAGVAEITSAAGKRNASTATIPILHVGGVVFRDVAAALALVPDDREDGLLPITFFRAIYIAANRDLVIIQR